MENKSVCFSGHRTEKLPQNITKLKKFIKFECIKAIDEGYTCFYHGACYGFDLICAEVVLTLKKHNDDIKLISVVPFIGQEKSWDIKNKELYKNILDNSDDVVILREKYVRSCYHERNRYMVDNSQKLICYCNENSGGTKYTLNYALSHSLDCINLATYY